MFFLYVTQQATISAETVRMSATAPTRAVTMTYKRVFDSTKLLLGEGGVVVLTSSSLEQLSGTRASGNRMRSSPHGNWNAS